MTFDESVALLTDLTERYYVKYPAQANPWMLKIWNHENRMKVHEEVYSVFSQAIETGLLTFPTVDESNFEFVDGYGLR